MTTAPGNLSSPLEFSTLNSLPYYSTTIHQSIYLHTYTPEAHATASKRVAPFNFPMPITTPSQCQRTQASQPCTPSRPSPKHSTPSDLRPWARAHAHMGRSGLYPRVPALRQCSRFQNDWHRRLRRSFGAERVGSFCNSRPAGRRDTERCGVLRATLCAGLRGQQRSSISIELWRWAASGEGRRDATGGETWLFWCCVALGWGRGGASCPTWRLALTPLWWTECGKTHGNDPFGPVT